MSKKEKQIKFLQEQDLSKEQIYIVLKMINESRKKLLDDIINALYKKKVKIDDE